MTQRFTRLSVFLRGPPDWIRMVDCWPTYSWALASGSCWMPYFQGLCLISGSDRVLRRCGRLMRWSVSRAPGGTSRTERLSAWQRKAPQMDEPGTPWPHFVSVSELNTGERSEWICDVCSGMTVWVERSCFFWSRLIWLFVCPTVDPDRPSLSARSQLMILPSGTFGIKLHDGWRLLDVSPLLAVKWKADVLCRYEIKVWVITD